MEKLIAGYRRFHKEYFENNEALYGQLKQGQNPSQMIIACSDSRADPALLLDCKPGDLFVVRNVANLIPPYETSSGYHGVSSALEYGVRILKVRDIIVLGHQQCGGIRALLEGVPDLAEKNGGTGSQFVIPWVNMAVRARDKILREMPNASIQQQINACEEESIKVSLENLMTFPWIKERADAGNLGLHGWYFDLETGFLTVYDAEQGEFKPLQ